MEEFDSSFETESEAGVKKRRLPSPDHFKRPVRDSGCRSHGNASTFVTLNAYERHKQLVNHYILSHPGSTALLNPKAVKIKRDIDIIRENYKFIWSPEDSTEDYGKALAKRYYDKLYTEYCVCDLAYFKLRKMALRWRIESEVISGKGQFTCGEKKCGHVHGLKSWEVNFRYQEEGVTKNALVKLRLCDDCSVKLNYIHQNKKRTSSSTEKRVDGSSGEVKSEVESVESTADGTDKMNVWKKAVVEEKKRTREEIMDEFLSDLFL